MLFSTNTKILVALCFSLLFTTLHAAVYQVTVTTFVGAGSISQAVANANANPGKDTIYFSIPGAGPHTILLGSELQFTQPIHINGTTQTGYNSLNPIPMIEFRNSPAMGVFLNYGATAVRSEIIGLAVNNNAAAGILVNAPNVSIKGCYVGLALDGVSDNGNAAVGIDVTPVSTSGNIIGGNTLIDRNVISGNNAHGIQLTLTTGNYIIGNYIGTNAAGNAFVRNSANGIQLSNNCTNNQIGGSTTDSSNVISGNNQHGIELNASTLNKVYGNVIGLQADKAGVLGNLAHGVLIINANSNFIGNTGLSTGNIISSNGSIGVNVINSNTTIIKSNVMGTTASTAIARPNQAHCIQLQNSRFTIIGGSHATEGNILSAAGGAGINIDPGCNKTTIKGNYIGTDNTGTLALGNFVIGIILKSDSCTVGGPNDQGNIIVDTKLFCGLLIADANANTVIGNLIGLGNNNTPLPNTTDGINISVETNGLSSKNNTIQFNTIAFNTLHGINVGKALNNFVNSNEFNNDLRFNSIYCNVQQGISLYLTNVADHGNNGKIAPAINNALSTENKVVGLANGLLPTDAIDIYTMSECANCEVNPQGKTFIATVFPDAAGNWSYQPSSPITGTLIAMATDLQHNSSQFSKCFTPCKAIAKISASELTIMMEMNKQETITFASTSQFSTLNPEPGKVYWSLGLPDTNQVFSKNPVTSLNFLNGTSQGAGGYTVYLIAKQNSCMDTTKVDLNLFFIPNLVTPNGDSQNDSWTVGNKPGQFDAKIYNRWGDCVYNKSDYTNEWDGSGLADGVYYFHLENKIEPNKPFKGWVEIVK